MLRRQPLVQVVARLVDKGDPAEAASLARSSVLSWLKDKQGLLLPDAAYQGESFEVDAAEGLPLSAVRFKNFWAMQFDRFDPEVPGRIWRTEASVAGSAQFSAAGVRLTVIDTAVKDRVPTSVPRIVQDLIVSPGLTDYGISLSMHAAQIMSDDDAWALKRLLENRARTRPVVVISEDEEERGFDDAEELASRLAGLAHVFFLKIAAQAHFIKFVGREFAVWNGAIRTYFPGFDAAFDELSQHPPATRAWIRAKFGGIQRFTWMLVGRFAERTILARASEEAMPSLQEVRRIALNDQIKELAKKGRTSEREKLLEQENELLVKAVKEKVEQYDYAAECVSEAEEDRDRTRAQLIALREKVHALEERLGASATTIDYPETFDGLGEWVSGNFAGRLVLLTRALRSAKKSPYKDKAVVYQCLEAIARSYVDARRSGQPVDGLFDHLGVQLERTGSESHLKQWEEEYFVPHRRGQKRFFEWHITKGNDHDPSNTLRIYFFYDEEDEQVYVGHLTSHLTNEKS